MFNCMFLARTQVARPLRLGLGSADSDQKTPADKCSLQANGLVLVLLMIAREKRKRMPMRSVSRRFLLGLTFIGLLFAGTSEVLCALDGNHNRPNPYMDYVPQEVGMYDAGYQDLTETECRQCHGASLAGRHHNSDIVTRDRLCEPCHDIIPNPPGVLVYRNCVVDGGTAGCHSWTSASGGINGWHHETATWDDPKNCVTCHNPRLITPIGEFRSLEQFPPQVVHPTPFVCENCHWDQRVTAGSPDPMDPSEAGHPSTFDHDDQFGNFVGYFWYGRKIQANDDTHHVGSAANFTGYCEKCHSADPHDEIWDPANPELIRYCELCHGCLVLMTNPQHMNDSSNWEAVGFHAPDPDTEPTGYRLFYETEKCFACHPGGTVPEPPPLITVCFGYGPDAPAIDHVGGISPVAGGCGAFVTLRGENFGLEQYEDSFVQMRKSNSHPWTNIPVLSWTQTQIEFEIPCGTLVKGNYRVRVYQGCGEGSNEVGFALTESHIFSPTPGPCSAVITLSGAGFGDTRNTAPDGVTGEGGITRLVDFVGSQGTYTATTYPAWSDTSVKVKFYNFFRDDSDPRNFVADGTDPLITKCNGGDPTWLGVYAIYLVTVYYTDTDLSGDLTATDVMTDATFSDPVPFELTADPVIYRLNSDGIDRGERLKIRGLNFGADQTDGEIRVGTKLQADHAALGKGTCLDRNVSWSDTLLKVKLNVPAKWQGKTRFVWVEKDGKKSNSQRIKILPAAP
jgi:hypothetical protein